jgi:serine/threonine protein kinase
MPSGITKQSTLSNKMLSHYRVISHLGMGGMGEVYYAHDTKLDRAVALKILRIPAADQVTFKDRLQRFVQEAQSASALNHPNIITIFEIGQFQNGSGSEGPLISGMDPADEQADVAPSAAVDSPAAIHYIAMEFIEGETLRSAIDSKTINLNETLEILAQVADGLSAAHAAGIIHRDLKPANIMIRKDGYAKILDFGISKLIAAPATKADDLTRIAPEPFPEKTLPGIILGTVGYMSPEQIQGKAIDHRSDIFAFGCILYESAAGKKAFAGDSAFDTLHRILYEPAPSFEELDGDVPVELQRIIRKCLAKEPEQRYQSIQDAARDLRELMEQCQQPAHATLQIAADGNNRPSNKQITTTTTTITTITDKQENNYDRIRQHQPDISSALSEPGSPNFEIPSREGGRWGRWKYPGLAIAILILLGVAAAILLPRLRSPAGRLVLESSPPGARVYLNDQLRGTTPLALSNLGAGTYTMRLDLQGYNTKVEIIDVGKQSDLQRAYSLTRSALPVPQPPSPATQSAAPTPRTFSNTDPAVTGNAVIPSKPAASQNKPFKAIFEMPVKHSHGLLQKCTGMLRLFGWGIEYQTSGSHSFKILYQDLKSELVSKEKIALQGTGISGGQIELEQLVDTPNPNVAEAYAKILNFTKPKIPSKAIK